MAGGMVQFDLPGALQAHNALVQQQRQTDTQNAFAQAIPMIQSDPQNALATVGRTGNIAAYTQLSGAIQQMDQQKRAAAAEKAEALGNLAISLKKYPDDPDHMVRKAVALSQASSLAQHGVTPADLQAADYSDQTLDMAVHRSMSVKDLIAQQDKDRTFDEKKTVDNATMLHQKNQDTNATGTLNVARGNLAVNQQKANQDATDIGGGLNDAAKINAAVKYNLTGTLPSFGMGKAARQDRLEVLNYAADLAKGKKPEELVAQAANFKALSGSLNKQTANFNALEQAANSAQNSANLALEAAAKGGAGPTGIPAFNKWIQAGRQATGDLNVKNLSNHLDTFAEEYAKVMTASAGSQAATDSARTAAKERISKAYDLDGLKSILSEMGREMGGRHYSSRAQIDSTKKQLTGEDYAQPQGVQTAAPAAAPAPGNIPPPPPGFVMHQ